MEDYERGASNIIEPAPWQTDTCIGDWHYKRSLFDQHRYKTVATVARMLIDIVSKNGNLLLSIPVRGDGTIDPDEHAFLEGMARWIAVNGEGIYGTRPWKIPAEGAARAGGGMFNEGRTTYTAADIRFTTKGRHALCVPDGLARPDSVRHQGTGHQFSATSGTENRPGHPARPRREIGLETGRNRSDGDHAAPSLHASTRSR